MIDLLTEQMLRRLDSLERDVKNLKLQIENDRIAMEERISGHETDYEHAPKPIPKEEIEQMCAEHEASE